MKILSLDIASFGKFKNYHLDLPDNMTVVFGENENGKSTIMAFIRMMFYGNTGKTSDIDKNPRIKYRPWDSELMAGSIVFEHGGKKYRLEREFKRSNSTDKITLIDLDTGIPAPLSGSDDIGAKFFGLTDAAFERSVFLSETIPSSKNEAANGEINSRLSNAATTGNDEISFEKISTRLQKAKEALFSRGGKKGLCDKAVVEKEAVKTDIRLAEENEIKLDELRGAIAEKEALLSASSAESAKLFDLLKSADKIKKKALTEKYLEAIEAKNKTEEKLKLSDGSIADKGFLDRSKKLFEELGDIKEELSEKEEALKALKAEIEALSVKEVSENSFAEDKAQLTHIQNGIDSDIETTRKKITAVNMRLEELRPVKKNNPVFFIIGLLIIIAGGVLFAVAGPIAGAAVLAAGLITAALGLIIKKKDAPDDTALKEELSDRSLSLSSLIEEKASVADKLADIEQKTRDIQVKALADKAIAEEKTRQAEGLNEEAKTLTSAVQEAEAALLAHLSLLSEVNDASEVAALITKTEEALNELDAATQKAELLADHAGIASTEQARSRREAIAAEGLPEGISEDELDSVKERFKTQSDQNGKIRSEISSLKAQLKAMAEGIPSVALLRLKEEELTKKIDGYNDFGAKVELAQEVLDEAFRELRKNYSGALETRTTEIFAHITEQKYSSVNVSKNFELGVTAAEVFGLKDSQYLSAGTEDQLYLALRLALAELMTEQTGVLPLLMDDPLAQYDDNRMAQTVEFLSDYAKERQLILFTCHTAVADAARANKVCIITL